MSTDVSPTMFPSRGVTPTGKHMEHMHGYVNDRPDGETFANVPMVRHCFGDRPDGETFANLGLDGETFS